LRHPIVARNLHDPFMDLFDHRRSLTSSAIARRQRCAAPAASGSWVLPCASRRGAIRPQQRVVELADVLERFLALVVIAEPPAHVINLFAAQTELASTAPISPMPWRMPSRPPYSVTSMLARLADAENRASAHPCRLHPSDASSVSHSIPFNALNSELELSRARLKSPLYPGNAGLRSGSRYSQTGSRDVEGLEYDRDSAATYRDNHEETTIALLCPMTRTVDERAVSRHRRRFWAQRWSACVGSAVVAARLA
jgi:hypothetical protein